MMKYAFSAKRPSQRERACPYLSAMARTFAQVLHGNRLAACSVVGYGDDDERYPFANVSCNAFPVF